MSQTKKNHRKRRPHTEAAGFQSEMSLGSDQAEVTFEADKIMKSQSATKVARNQATSTDGPEGSNGGASTETADDAVLSVSQASSSDSFADNQDSRMSAEESASESDGDTESEPFRFNFFGSDLVREKAPKAMDLADKVAQEWIEDGDFQGLPVGTPFAQFMTSRALRKAKDLEKKLEQKGVFTLARMGIELAKSKLNKNS